MTDWFKASIDLQKQMLDAGSTEALAKAQDAVRKAAEANMAAWQAWMNLWGIGL